MQNRLSCLQGRLFNVSEFFAENLSLLGPLPPCDAANPEISDEAYALAARLIIHIDKMEEEEVGGVCVTAAHMCRALPL